MIDVILASKSTIRKDMMTEANIPFEIIVSNADETPDTSKSFQNQIKEISMRKAKTVFEETKDRGARIIVAADQNIIFNDVMYGKPKTTEEARELIKSMEGKDNIYACTGNAVIYANGSEIIKLINNCETARMSMDNFSDEELEDYIKNKAPLTKCGGISIRELDYLHLEEGKMSTL